MRAQDLFHLCSNRKALFVRTSFKRARGFVFCLFLGEMFSFGLFCFLFFRVSGFSCWRPTSVFVELHLHKRSEERICFPQDLRCFSCPSAAWKLRKSPIGKSGESSERLLNYGLEEPGFNDHLTKLSLIELTAKVIKLLNSQTGTTVIEVERGCGNT